MSRKLHRGRTRVFHKRKFPVKAVAWLLAAAVIIPGSFFGAKYMLENRPASQPDVSVPPVSRPADASSQDSSQPADPSEPNTPAAGGALKAFYLPTAQLADSAKLSAALSAAKAAGRHIRCPNRRGEQHRQGQGHGHCPYTSFLHRKILPFLGICLSYRRKEGLSF